MQTFFKIQDGKINLSSASDANIHVFTAPSEHEKSQIIQKLGIDSYDFDAALDPDEISRVEFEQHYTAIIWKQAHEGSFSIKYQFDVLSIGFFIQGESLIVIGEDNIPFSERSFEGVNSINDIILRYFFHIIRQYLNHLKAIKQATIKLEGKLSLSLENKYFLQMLDISESLVYYINAIEANGSVLAKLYKNAEKLNLTPPQLDFLEDTIQENTQSARQAQIYSTVLSGLMDARGTIINNNMNTLLKNLTMINVVFLPLNLIASMGGMSEFTRILQDFNINWRIGYFLFSIVMVFMAWLIWITLRRYFGPHNNHHAVSEK